MIFIPLFLFLIGLLVGSFLNVVIIRLNTGRTFVRGRSSCDVCARTIAWYDLLPVVSFLGLGGKCRHCKGQISFQHPIVELVTAIAFLQLYALIVLPTPFVFGVWVTYIGALVALSFLIVIFVYDLRHKIIPDTVVYPLIILSVLAVLWRNLPAPALIGQELFIGVAVALPFFCLWYFSKGRLMGFGDVKLALAFAWLVGPSQATAALIMSFWIGGVLGLFLLALTKKYKMRSEVPFAPFMILGLAIAVCFHITLHTFFPYI